ncbi:MAG: AIR synthase family protein [Deltaproteobacteria bacterium]|nr:AIR synthase family protein [Deltaproteobacteria bacterium]
MKREALPTGKLDITILRKLLERHPVRDHTILVGPKIGEDAAAIDMGDRALIVSTDPITFATDEIGHYSVMVNANDIATTGAEPQWYTVTILIPEDRGTEQLVDSIFQQIYIACESLNISLIGGHTEITHGLDRPILVGQMMGVVQKEAMVRTSGAQPGDVILLSKGIPIEGTSVIARERAGDFPSLGISGDLAERARHFLFDPGISVVAEARAAFHAAKVHSMHDPTEGGLANGLHELSIAAGVEIEVNRAAIPVYEESRILCEAFHLDPLGVIASGALLITASPSEAEKISKTALEGGVPMTEIGRVKSLGSPSVTMITPRGSREPVPYFETDEIVKIFSG